MSILGKLPVDPHKAVFWRTKNSADMLGFVQAVYTFDRDWGMDPVRLLLETSKKWRFVRVERQSGMCPVSEMLVGALPPRNNAFKSVKTDSC